MSKYKIEIKWAIIFILSSLVWVLIERLCGLHGEYIELHPYLTMVFMIPAIWIFVLAIKEKKQNYYGGKISFKQGFISGLIITLIVAIFSPVTQWITFNFITPEFFTNSINNAVSTQKLSQQEALEYFNFSNYVVQSLVGSMVAGVVTSLAVAFFNRTKEELNK